MILSRIAGAAAAAAIATAAVAGCKSSSSTYSGVPASPRAAVPGAGQTTAKQAGQDLKTVTAKCGTGTASGQLAALKDLKSHAGLQALLARCGIPVANRQPAEAAALQAAEHAHLGTHAGRVTYFTGTLPAIVLRYQA